MPKKGLEGWVEIFRGGPVTDSQGRTHNGDEIIEKALASFSAAEHEPPLVIGHPEDNHPAYGWVSKLRKKSRNGVDVLEAKFKQVVGEVSDAVKSGLFKKRSAAFYKDGSLRHVGLLGAVPPAVKGLADIKFNDADDFYEFAECQPLADEDKERRMDFKEFVEMLKSLVTFNKEITALQQPPERTADPENSTRFSEADVEKLKAEAAEQARKEERERLEMEFAEKERTSVAASRQKNAEEWCERMTKEGKLTPALIKAGLPEVLNFLASSDDVIEFAETKDKKRADDILKSLFENELPKLVTFSEVAGRETSVGDGGAGEKLEALVKEKINAKPDMTYAAAFSEVQREHPDLANEYVQEMTG